MLSTSLILQTLFWILLFLIPKVGPESGLPVCMSDILKFWIYSRMLQYYSFLLLTGSTLPGFDLNLLYIPFIPPSTFNAQFSCSIWWSAPININDVLDFAMPKSPSFIIFHVLSSFSLGSSIWERQTGIIPELFVTSNAKKYGHNCWRLYKSDFYDCSLVARMNNRTASKSFK